MTGFGRFLAGLALLALVLFGAIWFAGRQFGRAIEGPAPETMVAASLQGLREQSRLSPFVARYVAVVTSTRSRFGLSAKQTLIMPGLVRYEVDLARLQDRDVRWNAAARTLAVTLPPVEVIGPQVDLTQIREYGDGGILSAISDADRQLDAANRKAGQQELVRQAREAVPMRLARDATRRAVERAFAMPLRATGLDPRVEVRFADEGMPSTERMDRSSSLEEVFANR